MPYSFRIQDNNTYPTPDAFKKLIAKADLEKNADDRPISFLGTRAINTNPRLKGYVQVRKTALSSFSWDIVPVDVANAVDVERAKAVKRRLQQAINAVIRNHTQTPLFGRNVFELNSQFSDVESAFVIRVAEVLKPWLHERVNDTTVNILADNSRKEVISTVNVGVVDEASDKYLVELSDALESVGSIRTILRLEIMKHNAMNDWANLNQLLKGFMHAIDKGGDEADSIAAEEGLQAAREGGWIKTSDLIEFKLSNAVDSSGGTSIKEFVQYIDSSIAVAVLGQANTTELPSGGGSRAALQVQKMISADIMWNDMQRAEVLAQQLVQKDFALNFSKTDIAPWRFKFNEFEEMDYEQQAIIVREALNTTLPFNSDEIYKRLGFNKPEGTADIVRIDNTVLA